MVSQVNYTEHAEHYSNREVNAEVLTSVSVLSKLLKIDLTGELSRTDSRSDSESVAKKVHTNVSLLSEFWSFIVNVKVLKTDFDVTKMKIGDFIETEGELQKNPLINYMDTFVDVFE